MRRPCSLIGFKAEALAQGRQKRLLALALYAVGIDDAYRHFIGKLAMLECGQRRCSGL